MMCLPLAILLSASRYPVSKELNSKIPSEPSVSRLVPSFDNIIVRMNCDHGYLDQENVAFGLDDSMD